MYPKLKKAYNATLNFINDFMEGDFFGLAAEISFYLLSTFLPMIILVFTAGSAISLNYTDTMFHVLEMLPDKAETLLVSMLVSHSESATVIAITALLSLTSMSGLILAAEKGLNRFYKLKNKRSIFTSYLIAIIFAILIFIAIIASFGLIIFGRLIGVFIAKYTSNNEILQLWNIFRYIAILVFISFTVSALYKALPVIKIKIRWVLPGAMFTTVAWYITSMLFALYVNNFPQYEIIYGSLAGFACMIVWIYMTGIIILAGAKINALIYCKKICKKDS